MFFFISKIVSFLFTPLFWIFVLLVWTALAKKPARKRKILIASLVLLYLFSNAFLQEEVNRLWEVPAMPYVKLEKYDAAIVLGGILHYDMRLDRIQFARTADRLWQAVELYKTGVVAKIFFVGGSGSIEFAHIKEGMFVRRYLLTLGIPDEDIWIENESRNTRENAVNAKAFLKKNFSIKGKFLLLTSGYHMRRALACFSKEGIQALPYSTDRTASATRRFVPDHLFIPDAETLWRWNTLFHEWIGMAVYKVKGYV